MTTGAGSLITQHSKKASEIKFQARQWYALWFEDYKAARTTYVSRAMFNPWFAKLLTDIKTGKRTIPDGQKDSVLELTQALLSDEKTEAGDPQLTRHYTLTFWSGDYELALDEANRNAANLPLYGERNFERIK